MLHDRLQQVRQRIERACARCGRDPAAVTLVAVTKQVAADSIREAVRLGLTHVGENRVQEAKAKREHLQDLPGVTWHMIGHLQRNKVAQAIGLFDVIQSVDSLELIDDLEYRLLLTLQVPQARRRVFIEVNVSGESTKFGCRPGEALEFAQAVMDRRPALQLEGLMTIAPHDADPQAARPHFRALRALRDEIQGKTRPASSLKLSMGMSHDFEVAIEEGADVIRIGTALFGERSSG